MLVIVGTRFRWVEEAYEPALMVFSILAALGFAYVSWEFWLRGK
jgi:hypothetical protein